MDRQQPFGNEHLLPRGTLREPPSHLARASTIFITKSDGDTAELRAAHRPAQSRAPASSSASITRSTSRTCSPASASAWSLLQGPQGRLAERHRPAGELRAKPGAAGRGAGLFQALRRPPPVHPAGSPQRHQPQQEAPGRGHHHHPEGRRALSRRLDRRDLPIYFMRVEIKILSGADDFQDCVRKICFR